MQKALAGMLGVLASIVIVSIVGCSGEDAPPYEELLVRDALRAEPKVVAAVLASDQRTLADRMEHERDAAHDPQRVDIDEKPLSAAEVVAQIDTARAANGKDAWVATIVRTESRYVEARSLSRRDAGSNEDPTTPLPPLEGEPASASTRDVEARALGGRAGTVLRNLVAETHATRLVRVTQWPAGAVAIRETVYVNAAWLVAMAALDDADAGTPRTPRTVVATTAPELAPLRLRGNPYATFTTLASCIADVRSRCDACLQSGACDATPTLTDFPDGRSECDFLGQDARRAAQLCALALTSVETVAECVKKDGCIPPTGAAASTSLPAADAFLAKDACVRSLNLCLSGTLDDGPDRALVDVRVEGCQSPFRACSSSFAACSSACDTGKCNSRGGPSCSSCDGCNGGCTRCSGWTKDSRTGDATGYGSTGTGQNPGTGSSSSGTSGTPSSSGTSGSASSSASSSSGSSGTSASSSSGGTSASSSSSSSSGGSPSSGGSSSGCGGCGGSSSSSGSSNSCGNCGGSSCKCETAPADDAPPFAPFSTMAWMIAPVLFLGSRARRSTLRRAS